MRNLNCYQKEPFEIHFKAVNQKNKGERKERLKKINPLIKEEYAAYSDAFEKKNLFTLSPNVELNKSKADLHSLYNYSNKTMLAFREALTLLQPRTIKSTCQSCSIIKHDTLDHILPQEKYPEFIVNPQNLIPTCSACNRIKSDVTSDSNSPRFLNLYLDELPNLQFLFIEISSDKGGELDYRFFLKNVDNLVEKELYENIEFHYNKLDLLERFKLASIDHESEFETTFSTFVHDLTIEQIATNLKIAAQKNQEAYGYNYWQSIMHLGLLESPLFLAKMEHLQAQEIQNV